jgi:transcriptional regulator of arginine metabolism
MDMQNARTFMQTDHQQAGRHEAILRILKSGVVQGQAELVRLLKKEGHAVTQSSVSRDLRELKVSRVSGRYVSPPDEIARVDSDFTALARFVRDIRRAGPSLTVIKTTIGTAQSVAVAIDRAEWPEVVGTISGDDTIFIATASAGTQSKLIARLREHFQV